MNITLYVSPETKAQLEYLKFEDALKPSALFARTIAKEWRRIRRQREREQRQPQEVNA